MTKDQTSLLEQATTQALLEGWHRSTYTSTVDDAAYLAKLCRGDAVVVKELLRNPAFGWSTDPSEDLRELVEDAVLAFEQGDEWNA